MSGGKIFLVAGQHQLRPLEEKDFELEEHLQRLLVDYWDLLPGDQVNPEDPRRWLLVTDEMGVPDQPDGSDRWSLDHLFLDQDAIPTLVECKRSSDTRIRREVVAQMLEYAANGSVYWRVGQLREAFEAICARCGRNAEEELLRVLGEQPLDADGYWRKVESNLKEGRVRLLFVTDEAPKELRRLVEFMNEKMQPDVEAFIVEIKQFIGEGHQALVPRLIGRVERATTTTASRTIRTAEEILAASQPEAAKLFKTIFEDAAKNGLVIGLGTVGFSMRVKVSGQKGPVTFGYGYPPKQFMFYFDPKLPLTEGKVEDLRRKLADVGLFKVNKTTLECEVDATNLQKALTAWKIVLEWAPLLSGAATV